MYVCIVNKCLLYSWQFHIKYIASHEIIGFEDGTKYAMVVGVSSTSYTHYIHSLHLAGGT